MTTGGVAPGFPSDRDTTYAVIPHGDMRTPSDVHFCEYVKYGESWTMPDSETGYPIASNPLSQGDNLPGGGSAAGEDVVGVDDGVGITLFGQEPLPVRGIVLVDGVAGHHGVEVRGSSTGLRPEHPAQPLRLLLA